MFFILAPFINKGGAPTELENEKSFPSFYKGDAPSELEN